MKITLDYNETTGELSDSGVIITNIGIGFIFSEQAKSKIEESSVHDLVKLKDAGFNAQEIMQMKREGLV